MGRLKIKGQSTNDSFSQFDFGFLDIENVEYYDLNLGRIDFSLPFGNVIDIEKVISSSLDLYNLDERLSSIEGIKDVKSFPCVILTLYDYTYGKEKGEKLFFVTPSSPYDLVIGGILEEKHEYHIEVIN